ncbi:hypothetical protein B1812_08325 [Methylocystis bryophila]|uniref:Uncharacterized protein n=1 Tax=Methylocystis bryophila TaxID=655015 RepID=A0A1W6MTZ7_9HYPH|nr:hypothetical protein B1812_08325 [Methylocystis bryophila]
MRKTHEWPRFVFSISKNRLNRSWLWTHRLQSNGTPAEPALTGSAQTKPRAARRERNGRGEGATQLWRLATQANFPLNLRAFKGRETKIVV